MTRSLWIKVAGLIAAVWVVAGAVIWWVDHTKPTPERLQKYLSNHPLEGKSASDRAREMQTVADQLNGLTYEQRREVRMSKSLNRFFRTLSPDEQDRFLDLTLPAGFKQMMEAFNKMDSTKRKLFVDRAMKDMERNENGEGRGPAQDDPHLQKMVQEGMKSFYSDASAEVKMDFAPLIEQMQKNLQFGGK